VGGPAIDRGRIRIGRLLGVPIWLHLNWIFIFGLIWLAVGGQPGVGAGAGAGLFGCLAGLVVTLLFFATILGHEIAHALVARRRGVPVLGITLSFLGGAAEIERDADRPLDEFLISVAGPLSSLGFAGGFYLAQWGLGALAAGDESGFMTASASYAGLLGTINLWLAGFNSIPGFPLDGGRALRAVVWNFNGDLVSATRVVATLGRLIGVAFAFYGLLGVTRGRPEEAWFLFVGWFLYTTATQSYRQAPLQRRLRAIPAGSLMHTNFAWADAGAPLAPLLAEHFAQREAPALPVIEDGRWVGFLTPARARAVPAERHAWATARDAMTPVGEIRAVEAGEGADALLRLFQTTRQEQAPIVQDGRLVGVVGRADLLPLLRS
jgi:Zn-dependent protease